MGKMLVLSASDFRQPVQVEVPSDAKPVEFNHSHKAKCKIPHD
jgi:hypothetical protein